jgi:hypothetical protein
MISIHIEVGFDCTASRKILIGDINLIMQQEVQGQGSRHGDCLRLEAVSFSASNSKMLYK